MRRRTLVKHGGAARARGAMAADVQLAWARDRDGGKVRASRLGPADRRGRAPFTCLGCGDPLVPHLGRIRAPHFAHLPGSRCPLTAPETALHLDAKERLLALCADAFAGVRPVTLRSRCPVCRRGIARDLGALGDAAEGEGAVGALRADVLVRARGAPALAIEVEVTHAMDDAKEAALRAAGVPAVEVDAREEWEQEAAGAVEIVCARSVGFEPGPACTTLARTDVERARGGEAAEIAELEAYRARGFLVATPVAKRARARGPGARIGRADLAKIQARFCCSECGSSLLSSGPRLVRHACASAGMRPVAWISYDGALVGLSWWRR